LWMTRNLTVEVAGASDKGQGKILMKRYIFFFAIVLAGSMASADDIILVGDPWCPYNCSWNDENPGFMVEIARTVLKQNGHTVKYFNVPWARAIYGTREGQYDGIIGTGRTETPDFVFPDIELGLARHTFYVKKGNPWRYDGPDSLKTITLGVIKNYSYGDLFNEYIVPNQDNPKRIQVISGENGLALNIKKLEENKIEAIIEDRAVFQHYLQETNMANNFSEAGIAYTENVYIAFSPKLKKAPAYAEMLTKGMKALRKSKRLSEILEKYGLEDWK
jgi:polar amino acid transport system substrate-binding protein